jgi:hypothetical protein
MTDQPGWNEPLPHEHIGESIAEVLAAFIEVIDHLDPIAECGHPECQAARDQLYILKGRYDKVREEEKSWHEEADTTSRTAPHAAGEQST